MGRGTRAEHLQWCKDRALEYLPDDPKQAMASMLSDMRKHDETVGHPACKLGMMLILNGHLKSAPKVRKFIQGFN